MRTAALKAGADGPGSPHPEMGLQTGRRTDPGERRRLRGPGRETQAEGARARDAG